MKKQLFAIGIILMMGIGSTSAQSNVSSQSYTTALGVKFYPGAISLKHFVKPNAALEGIGYFWNRGSRITGLYEIHGDINNAPGLKWYIGPGAHIGFYNNKYGGGTSAGVDGVLGLDYKFKGAPINMSIDWQPSFEFGDNYGNGFNGNWGGLAIRYVF
ncbi:MAG TPA: hypothetical protein VLR49_05075 [Ferruginibacter sp.]|nr:hypothetical protein [Ferruginibacter sp.]